MMDKTAGSYGVQNSAIAAAATKMPVMAAPTMKPMPRGPDPLRVPNTLMRRRRAQGCAYGAEGAQTRIGQHVGKIHQKRHGHHRKHQHDHDTLHDDQIALHDGLE